MASMGEYVTSGKRGKTCNQGWPGQNMKPIVSAGNYETSGKRGKSKQKARENVKHVAGVGMKPVSSADTKSQKLVFSLFSEKFHGSALLG